MSLWEDRKFQAGHYQGRLFKRQNLMENKMLAIKAEENVIRLFPPLIVNNNQLDEAITKIEKVCKEMS